MLGAGGRGSIYWMTVSLSGMGEWAGHQVSGRLFLLVSAPHTHTHTHIPFTILMIFRLGSAQMWNREGREGREGGKGKRDKNEE